MGGGGVVGGGTCVCNMRAETHKTDKGSSSPCPQAAACTWFQSFAPAQPVSHAHQSMQLLHAAACCCSSHTCSAAAACISCIALLKKKQTADSDRLMRTLRTYLLLDVHAPPVDVDVSSNPPPPPAECPRTFLSTHVLNRTVPLGHNAEERMRRSTSAGMRLLHHLGRSR